MENNIKKLNEDIERFLEESKPIYQSIEEMDKLGVWNFLKNYCEYEEATKEYYLYADAFRDAIDDIMSEPDEFPKDIDFDLRNALGAYYDELLDHDISKLIFIYEEDDEPSM